MRVNALALAGAAITGFTLAFAGAASYATTANPVRPPLASAKDARPAAAGRPRSGNVATPSSCATNYPTTSFNGVHDVKDHAGGEASAVLGGENNEACEFVSGIGAGQSNGIGNSGDDSFIGGGALNGITSADSFIGAGIVNAAAGTGSFVGAGDWTYFQRFPTSAYGNIASGADSFVGAGDLNQVSGQGSFIGAGGSSYAAGGATAAGNQIAGTDSFVGAGDQNNVGASQAFVGAGQGNTIGTSAGDAVIAGGFQNLDASGGFSFIGAGSSNVADAQQSFVGAGRSNALAAAATYSAIVAGSTNDVDAVAGFVGGGYKNAVATHGTGSALYGAILGGSFNTVYGAGGSVGGGSRNSASGTYATVPGGTLNVAGNGSFAAGTQARALHDGTFAWSDNAGTTALQSTGNDQFLARASGGYYLYSNATDTAGVKLAAGSGTWASLSDRAFKSGVAPLDDAAVLAKVAALPVSEWSYTSERGVRHVGPMAQDFYAAFRVGEDDRHITSIDEDGVALAAIKALHAQNAGLRMRLARADARLAALERRVAALATEVSRVSR